jgi:hypothetical protein
VLDNTKVVPLPSNRAPDGIWLLAVLAVWSCRVESRTDAAPDGAISAAGAGGDAAVGGPESCPPGLCNYQLQEGCPSDETCHPTLTDAGTVVPGCQPSGSVALGERCTAWGECYPGLFCGGNTCRMLCCGGDNSDCPPRHVCRGQAYIQLPDADAAVPAGVQVCIPVGDCDVFGGDCGSGEVCQIVDALGNVACGVPGSGQFADPCSPTEPCAAGFICVVDSTARGEPSCRRLCRMDPDAGGPACPEEEGACSGSPHLPEGVGECIPTSQ